MILLTVVTTDAPYVTDKDRVTTERLGEGFYRLTVRYGFMQEPDVPAAVASASTPHFPIDLETTTFFVGIETLLPTKRPGMALWRERFFALMSKNAVRATSFYRIPPQRVVEIGMQVEL